eukprot:scaffold26900_cov117-Cylindrotheca_fusiformis.AAC.4
MDDETSPFAKVSCISLTSVVRFSPNPSSPTTGCGRIFPVSRMGQGPPQPWPSTGQTGDLCCT